MRAKASAIVAAQLKRKPVSSAMIPSEVKTREFWLGAGSAVVAGLVGFLALLATCTATDAIGTDYSLTAEYPSPSGEKRAIVYVGDVNHN